MNRILNGLGAILVVLSAGDVSAVQDDKDDGTDYLPLQFKLSAEGDPFHASNQAKPVPDAPFKVFRGQTVRVTISGQPKAGHYTYPIVDTGNDNFQPSLRYSFPEESGVVPIGPLNETRPSSKVIDGKPKNVYEGAFTWHHDLLILPDAKPGIHALVLEVDSQVCSTTICNPVKATFKFKIEIAEAPVADLTAELSRRRREKLPQVNVLSSGVVSAKKDNTPAVKQEKGTGTDKLPIEYKFSTNGNRVLTPDSPLKVIRGQTVRVTITGQPKPGLYTYPIVDTGKDNFQPYIRYYLPEGLGAPPDGKIDMTKLLVVPIGPIDETKPTTKLVEGKNKNVYVGPFTWSHDLLILPDAKPGIYPMVVEVTSQICNDVTCFPVRAPFRFQLEIADTPPTTLSADLLRRKGEKPAYISVRPLDPKTVISPKSTNKEGGTGEPKLTVPEGISASEGEYRDTLMNRLAPQFVIKRSLNRGQAGDSGLLMFILVGAAWGLISLVTPCVFPMIPITVSFFLKQSEKEHHRPVTMAAIYSGTIILVLTLAATLFIRFFQEIIVHPVMNFAIGALFIYFALSLLGMYEIELPAGLARFTSAREGQGGYFGVIFMALTFTIISFACVAPFLGGFAGTSTATRPMWQTVLGGLAFATTFAAPFFFLALFPTLLKKMPKSGSWLNSVKVVMGFLELAAAVKFLRSGELLSTAKPAFFTFDFSLGLYVALALACAFYLLNIYRLPHDSPVEHLSVPRLLFSLVFLAVALYLAPALFKINNDGEQQRPQGTVYAWVESFLLPEMRSEAGKTGNLDGAIQVARDYRRKTGKVARVFLDCTGVNCSNCRLNENNVFNQLEIRRLFEPYLFVTFYTDEVPLDLYATQVRRKVDNERRKDDGRTNLDFQETVFKDSGRPYYAILEPRIDDDKIDVYVFGGGVISDVNQFAEYLRQPDGE
jgi:cytochrome c biogenesis protein CcdA